MVTLSIYFLLMTFATFAFALTFTLAFFFSFAALFVVSTLAFCTGSLMKLMRLNLIQKIIIVICLFFENFFKRLKKEQIS